MNNIIFIPTVEIAVKHLEDDPTFNAGHGSALNIAGEIEMDAIIMDGRTLGCGAVAGVRNIAHPVSLARMVMEKTNHIMLIGSGANKFAKEMGIPEVDPLELVSDYASQKWEEFRKYTSVSKRYLMIQTNHRPPLTLQLAILPLEHCQLHHTPTQLCQALPSVTMTSSNVTPPQNWATTQWGRWQWTCKET